MDSPAQPLPSPESGSRLDQQVLDTITEQMLFSPDRNPYVRAPAEAEQLTEVPDLPVVHGIAVLPNNRAALISPAGGSQRLCHTGDTVEEFVIATITEEAVVFSWKTDLFPVQVFRAPYRAAALTNHNQQPLAISSPTGETKGPGALRTPNVRACVAGDPSPVGTVIDGWIKVATEHPPGCDWVR